MAFKVSAKEIDQAQVNVDIAKSRGMSTREVFQFDHIEDKMLFDGETASKPRKSELVTELEKYLCKSDFTFSSKSNMKSSVVVDFMSQVRKIKLTQLKVFEDMFQEVFDQAYGVCNMEQMDIVYDSYVETSLKELESIRCALLVEPLTYINLQKETPIPVQIDRFWACSKNKENLQVISREFFISFSSYTRLYRSHVWSHEGTA